MVIHNFWAVYQKGYYTCCWSLTKTGGRGLCMDENWPAGDNLVINPYMSVGRIPLHDLTTTISVANKTFKKAPFWKCVIVYQKATRKKNYEIVLKAKIQLHLFQQHITHHTPPLKQAIVKPPPVQTSPAHASFAQKFLTVNVSNRAAQCQISWPATARKQQRDSHA